MSRWHLASRSCLRLDLLPCLLSCVELDVYTCFLLEEDFRIELQKPMMITQLSGPHPASHRAAQDHSAVFGAPEPVDHARPRLPFLPSLPLFHLLELAWSPIRSVDTQCGQCPRGTLVTQSEAVVPR